MWVFSLTLTLVICTCAVKNVSYSDGLSTRSLETWYTVLIVGLHFCYCWGYLILFLLFLCQKQKPLLHYYIHHDSIVLTFSQTDQTSLEGSLKYEIFKKNKIERRVQLRKQTKCQSPMSLSALTMALCYGFFPDYFCALLPHRLLFCW